MVKLVNEARRLSGNISIRARLMLYNFTSKVRRVSKYLDETDIRDELVKRMKGNQPRRFSCPGLQKLAVRRQSEPPSPSRHTDGQFGSPAARRRRNTGIPSTMYTVDYRKVASRRYSTPCSLGGSRNGMGSSMSGFDSVESSSSLEPLPDENDEDIEYVDDDYDNKEGKFFISTEYSSDEHQLFVFVTQCGSVKRDDIGRRLRVCFGLVSDGVVSKKHCRDVKKNGVSDDFRYNYTYTVPFDSYEKMVKSGVTVQIKLKSCSILKRKKTLKTTELSLHDVKKDPVWRAEQLFF